MVFFYFILVVILCLINVLTIYNITSSLEAIRQPIQVLLILLALYQIVFHGDRLKRLSKAPIIICALLFFYLLFQLLLNSINIFNDFSNSLFGIIVFSLFYVAKWNSVLLRRVARCSVFLLLLFSILYIYRHIDSSFTNIEAYSLYANSIYYPICFLPFALIDKKYALLSIFSVLACTIISTKQGAFVILAISILIYYYVNKRLSGKKIGLKFLALICILTGTGIYLYGYIVETYNIDVMDGFSIMSETGGSGRYDIYLSVLTKLDNNSITQFFFGHGGLNSVANDIGISAHNDFLEVMYDFGLIGFCLYIAFIVLILKKSIVAFKLKSELTVPLLISITAFLVLSMVSHIMFILKYGLLLFSFLGMSMNLLNYRKNEN